MSEHLGAERLIAFYDRQLGGEEESSIQAHISQCDQCANRLQHLALNKERIRRFFWQTERSDCPPDEQVLGYFNQKGDEVTKKQIEQHLQVCKWCEIDYAPLMNSSPPTHTKECFSDEVERAHKRLKARLYEEARRDVFKLAASFVQTTLPESVNRFEQTFSRYCEIAERTLIPGPARMRISPLPISAPALNFTSRPTDVDPLLLVVLVTYFHVASLQNNGGSLSTNALLIRETFTKAGFNSDVVEKVVQFLTATRHLKR